MVVGWCKRKRDGGKKNSVRLTGSKGENGKARQGDFNKKEKNKMNQKGKEKEEGENKKEC